jgi:hypothetical protein
MRIIVAFVILVCVASGSYVLHAQAPDEGENVAFRWGFGAFLKSGKFVPITRDTTLQSGEELKMVIELVKDCFVYLIYQSSRGDIHQLFPYETSQFLSNDYVKGKNYYIPKGRSWFKLDTNTGRETFYLIAAVQRLPDLELLLSKYQSADNASKPSIASDIVKEIRDVKRRFRTFATLAERPATIGGNIRGVTTQEEVKRPDVATIATHISATNFYSKTYSIDHK